MNRKIVIMILAAMATLTGACSTKSDSPKTMNSSTKNSSPVDNGTTLVTELTTTTTTDSVDVEMRSRCATIRDGLVSVWSGIADTLQKASDAHVEAYIAKQAVVTLRSAIKTSRSWISICGSYYPDQAAQFGSYVDRIEPLVDQLDSVS